MRYSLNALKERIRSARRRRDRKRFRDNFYRSQVETLEDRVVLAPLLSFGFFGVPENSPVGTFVGQASVLFPEPELTFEISGGNNDVDGDGNGAFNINASTGEIFVNDQDDLDFETQANFVLSVTATDNSGSATEFQVISLSDVAENSVPVIDDPGTVNVPENAANGTSLVTMTGSDPEGENLVWSITGGNVDVDGDENAPFSINPTTGEVTINDSGDINFEGAAPNPNFNVTIRATDDGQGAFFSERTVTFAVQDQNDSPVVPAQTFTIPENTANTTLVGTLTASDEDAGQALTFTLNNNPANDLDGDGRAPFTISAAGVVRVNDSDDINYELMTGFDVSITVSDNNEDPGDPDPIPNPASTTTTFRVNLLNVIENIAPVVNDQTFDVSENAANGAAVGTVVASDADAGQSLTYSITGGNDGANDRDGDGNGPFAIDPATGEITVNDTDDLDSGANPQIALTVMVQDDGEDNLTDTATITIDVLDVNDPPVAEDQSLAVAENAAEGALVGDPVVASDPNGDTLTFTLVGPGDTTTFDIDANTGQITVAAGANLDFEIQNTYTLNVLIEDNGVPVNSVTPTITIQVQNQLENNAPVVDDLTFPEGDGATFAENREVGFVIGSATFTDPAFPGQLGDTPHTFSITGGNTGGAFAIDPDTGEITVADQFAMDFETSPVFSLEVSVTDSGEGSLVGTGTITINLRDANDPPVIAADQLGVIDEDAAGGSPVLQLPFLNNLFLSYTDQDAGDTSTFTILSQTAVSTPAGATVDVGGGSAFTLDATTGQFFTGDSEDYDFDRLYELLYGTPVDAEEELAPVTVEIEVQATDEEGAMSAPEIVTVVIRNVDDNTAPDAQAQQGFSFDIASDVDGEGGFDALSSNAAVGECSAQLSPDHSSLALVGCNTDSTEDGTAEIRAGSPTGDVLVSGIPVVGGDMPPFVWTPLTQSPNPLFGEEGEPEFIPTPFDANALSELLANDTLFLVLNLAGGDVGGQMRLNPNGTDAFVIDENADGINNVTNGDVVGQLTATDAEGYPLSYEIIGGNPNLDGDSNDDGAISAFSINDDGEIIVNDRDDLDADVMPQINLQIRVTDAPVVPDFPAGHPSFVFRESAQSTTTNVEINLRDLNDAPRIDPVQQFGSVLEGSEIGVTLVGDPIQATDGDGDALTFAITNGDPVPFDINPTTGQVFVDGLIDFETTPFFNVTVSATDGDETANGLMLVLVLNAPENNAPMAPVNVNSADPAVGGLSFDLNRAQTVPVIAEGDHPGTSGSCTYTYEPLHPLGGGGEKGSINILCTHDVTATVAHLHLGAPGVAGGVVAAFDPATSPMTLTIDEGFDGDLAAADTFAEVEAALLAGELYVNVHSEAHPSGEIRGQLPAPALNQLSIDESTADTPLVQGAVVGDYLGASDPDGDNVSLTYDIVGGNPDLNGNGQVAFAIDPDTGEISVNDPGDLNYEAQDQFFLDISVTDEPPLDAPLTSVGRQQIDLMDVNDAPAFGPIFSLFSPLDELMTDINGVDVDQNQDFVDSLFAVLNIETTGLAPTPVDANAVFALGLFVDGGLFTNFFGGGEKWLRAAPVGPGLQMDWYFILPTGELVRWDETSGSLTGESQGFFGVEAHADPIGQIVNAADPGDYPLPTEVELVIDEVNTGFGLNGTDPNTLTITRDSGAGSATLTLQVCDALDNSFCDTETILVEYGENLAPTLDPIGDQTSAVDALVIDLAATDPNPGATLTFDVALSSNEFDLQQQNQFFIDGSIFLNALGSNEKWVKSAVDNQWYFILEDNTLFRWDRTSAATGTFISDLNDGVYDNLSLLLSATNDVPATAEIVGNQLTITRDAGFTGFFNATVTVTDGADADAETIRVTYQ